ncbi:class I SAM-dependent methyltransferase [Couchioplanes azureus]|uniref:class I SAM-dependent methyltransferase n=1 Tax=Couchioplanes caeruleus TaxID=56438 RepID=UPI0016701C6D|nr:class I SAM-dependent methyltransferase [Couchioplanes caeruleus]GGQ73304.1 methyltransferase [Couchioplanes caeruleus subsp. azureus]
MATTAGALSATPGAERPRDTWDDVMAGFVPGLATLEQAIHDAAQALRPDGPRRVLDLGGGPGVLAARMARRWPSAAVTLLDLDPVLLALARAAGPRGVAVVDADLTSPAWTTRAGGAHDLITVVMTMHYLNPREARALYADALRCLAPGGLLVVADLMPDDGAPTLMRALDPGAGEAAAELAWAQWWDDAARMPELRQPMRARADLFGKRTPAEFTAGVSWHAEAARTAGFAEAGLLWRCGRHAALAALAPA